MKSLITLIYGDLLNPGQYFQDQRCIRMSVAQARAKVVFDGEESTALGLCQRPFQFGVSDRGIGLLFEQVLAGEEVLLRFIEGAGAAGTARGQELHFGIVRPNLQISVQMKAGRRKIALAERVLGDAVMPPGLQIHRLRIANARIRSQSKC